MKCKIYLHFEVNRTAQSLQKVFNIGIAQQELLNVLKMLGLVENLIDKFHINTPPKRPSMNKKNFTSETETENEFKWKEEV